MTFSAYDLSKIREKLEQELGTSSCSDDLVFLVAMDLKRKQEAGECEGLDCSTLVLPGREPSVFDGDALSLEIGKLVREVNMKHYA